MHTCTTYIYIFISVAESNIFIKRKFLQQNRENITDDAMPQPNPSQRRQSQPPSTDTLHSQQLAGNDHNQPAVGEWEAQAQALPSRI